jgi:hypothetical protein
MSFFKGYSHKSFDFFSSDLGYFHFSLSWILLAVLIYLFRQRQRSQFKLRHKMLKEINNNEERYIKARLDELPSWVNKNLLKILNLFSSIGFFS